MEARERGKRLQFEFKPREYDILCHCKDLDDADTFRDVVYNALRVYEHVLVMRRRGYEFYPRKERRSND